MLDAADQQQAAEIKTDNIRRHFSDGLNPFPNMTANNTMNTIAEFLKHTDLPKLEARMLVQHLTGLSRAQLITQDNAPLPSEIWAKLTALAQRRSAGEPMAYLLGGREFYGRWFKTTPATLIPRPETEHLVEAVMERLPQGGSVWDLGTGSGAIAVTLACERPDAAVRASDISREALAVAEENARQLGAKVEFLQGSWFEAERPSEKKAFDVIVSNPPYIEAGDEHLQQGDLRFEPQTALTDFSDGLSCIRILAAEAGKHLKAGGWLLVEHGYNQGEAARQIFTGQGWSGVVTLQDLAGLDRITLGCKV
ncbi:peptide chain release factor N(5)-glutamine methyltransferase [Neisseria weaveri]|uniref:Release factor glutamine methyltransferase n=2 Tax=Pseudomonadota TaxID=1224 RepID=A0A448VMU2_9NEIS|nr:peptide chain release factor N(5)-glutamine methyltransferase [Neisseria weaveri]EGV34898.1 protein-glutamine-N5 methyltransferase, release factor-specific [Neisseria weaveri LMG 5135]VEJ51087.1 HemK protein [Neisseria weaveri]